MNYRNIMKELPESERPYEKCLRFGTTYLSDAELLAVILRSGTPGENSRDLAIRLLHYLEERGGLGAIASGMTVEELCQFRGIGKVKSIQLLCIAELAKRISRQNAENDVCLYSPSSIAAYYMEELCHLQQEVTAAVFFNTKNKLLHCSIITKGTVNASLITPREVFIEAMKYQAVYLVLLHNHPSGDPTPSREDLVLTNRMAEAGQLLEIPLIDHIIIGDHRYVSLKERGYIE
ncbi:MAG: DNA repair protein RadC [Clostridiales bacterium]|nr:DNA repair protein RadC [Clostridiales bacterium]